MIRIIAATFVASVISYGFIFLLKLTSRVSWRPDCVNCATLEGFVVFVLIQMLGLCFAIKIFGGTEISGSGDVDVSSTSG
jgi:hypothetical protein